MPRIRPEVDTYTVRVRAAAPQATWLATALGRLLGRTDLQGSGAVRLGYPAIGTDNKYLGYANSPQLFIGYDPRKVAAGAFRGAPGALPSTTSPASVGNSPLVRAMATVTNAQLTKA